MQTDCVCVCMKDRYVRLYVEKDWGTRSQELALFLPSNNIYSPACETGWACQQHRPALTLLTGCHPAVHSLVKLPAVSPADLFTRTQTWKTTSQHSHACLQTKPECRMISAPATGGKFCLCRWLVTSEVSLCLGVMRQTELSDTFSCFNDLTVSCCNLTLLRQSFRPSDSSS